MALEKLGKIYKNIDELDLQCKPARRFKSTQKLRGAKEQYSSNLFAALNSTTNVNEVKAPMLNEPVRK